VHIVTNLVISDDEHHGARPHDTHKDKSKGPWAHSRKVKIAPHSSVNEYHSSVSVQPCNIGLTGCIVAVIPDIRDIP
jgi:hypothetical protein